MNFGYDPRIMADILIFEKIQNGRLRDDLCQFFSVCIMIDFFLVCIMIDFFFALHYDSLMIERPLQTERLPTATAV
jgi:hypothetical protein